LWNYKPEKIKRKTIIAEYDKGGLRMLDVASFQKAQKAMWAKRLMEPGNASWKAVPLISLSALLGQDTFKCNMNCSKKPNNFPEFYWQIIKSWNEAKCLVSETDTAFNIRNQWLWLNKQIMVNNIPIRWDEWHNHGINIIHDIVHENGTFLSALEINDKYHYPCDIFEYNSLKDAIPLKWRLAIKGTIIPSGAISATQDVYLKIGKNLKHISQITNKEIYWILVRNVQIQPIMLNKLINDYGIDNTKWGHIFTISKVIRDTKIRAFQYRLLFNLIPCNKYLKQIKRSDTDICADCLIVDDLPHYFCNCQQIRIFWNNFKLWWEKINEVKIVLSNKIILLGVTENIAKNELINACIILAKWHIYKKKLDNSAILFYNYLCDLRYFISNEKSIALRNNKLTQHNLMWQAICDQLKK
jgi:hypothetical protein